MYIIPALPLLLLVLSSQPSVADEDNPVTIRFHCQRGCCDHHEWCRFWASVGECRSNREWMADNCQLVCGSCRPGSTRAPRPPGASAPVRSPPRPPRPGTSQSPNPRPSNARQGGRRPPPRVSMRDPQPLQPRIQDRRPQRPVTTTQLRTTQRTFPFTRPTRPFRPRPNPSINDTQLDGIITRHRSDSSTATRLSLHAQDQHLAPSQPQTGLPIVTSPLPETDNNHVAPTEAPALINEIEQNTEDLQRTPIARPEAPRLQPQAPRPQPQAPLPQPAPQPQPQAPMPQPRIGELSPQVPQPQPILQTIPVIVTSTTVLTTTTVLTSTVMPTTTTEVTTLGTTATTTTTASTTSATTTTASTTALSTTEATTTTGSAAINSNDPVASSFITNQLDLATPSTTETNNVTVVEVRPPPRQPPSPLRATSPLLPRRFFNRQQSFTTTTRPLPPPPTTRPLPPPTVRTFPPTTQMTTTTTRAPPPSTPNAARCQAIINDPLVAAEEMWREHLVVATEDNSNRKTVDLDAVIRSNLANVCVPRLDETNCERNLCYNAYFRTMDGTCNNLHHPLRGAAYRPYTRLLPTVYDNALSEPVGSLIPNLRPSPRAITRHLTSSHASVVSEDYNAMVMQFGQFISHDMAKTTLVPSAKCNVCQNITSRCMAVPIEPDDPNAGFRRNGCVRVSRSSPICGSGNQKPRQQLNENTAYIDASPIYGSSVADMSKFRQGNTGFLKLPSFNGMSMLPFDQSKCRSRSSCTVIFTAGDSRVNLFVGLSAWHTMFTREHNRIASTLSRLNPHWNGDRLYQEARKIVGAEVQAIVYREWLPKILGAAFSSVVGDYRGYDPTVDATIANEFTSAAFRFGHGMIQEFYQRLDPNFGNSSFGALALQKGTLHSDVLVNEGGPDPLVRGMFSQNVKRPQRVTTTVTENMFGSTDLSTINIQRGRDHGHPSYTKYRELCGMGIATSFDHLSREILNTATRDKLQKIYGSVDRIDLWVGALLEDPVIRGLVGPTIACIVGPQFKRTRDGDRFYYENPGVFSRPQLSEIRKSSLSRIICDNTNTITMVPREAFRIGHLTACSQIPQMDLNKWKE